MYKLDVDPLTYLPFSMSALICGNNSTNTDALNYCDKDSISQPDNLSYALGHDGLIIGARTDYLGQLWAVV